MIRRLPYENNDITIAMVNVRCITCSKVLASKQEEFERLILEVGMAPGEALDKMGITRFCCRIEMLCPPVYVAGARDATFRRHDPEDLETQFVMMQMDQQTLPPPSSVETGKNAPRVYNVRNFQPVQVSK